MLDVGCWILHAYTLFLDFYLVLSEIMPIFAVVNDFVMSTTLISKAIADYFKTQPVVKARLFGSYSRDEQREDPDVDILILPNKSQHFSLFTLSDMYEDLKSLLGCEIDLTTVGGLMPFARLRLLVYPHHLRWHRRSNLFIFR